MCNGVTVEVQGLVDMKTVSITAEEHNKNSAHITKMAEEI